MKFYPLNQISAKMNKGIGIAILIQTMILIKLLLGWYHVYDHRHQFDE